MGYKKNIFTDYVFHIGFLVRQTSIWMRDSQTRAVICRVCFNVIPAPGSSAVSDPSPCLSAKRPTGRNQTKLPLLIQRDRWIPSRSLWFFFTPLFSSLHPPPHLRDERKHIGETGHFYVNGTVLTATASYCISHCSDLLITFRLPWLNLLSWCSHRRLSEHERLFFCLQAAVVLSPQHTNHCGGGKDTPLGPTLS